MTQANESRVAGKSATNIPLQAFPTPHPGGRPAQVAKPPPLVPGSVISVWIEERGARESEGLEPEAVDKSEEAADGMKGELTTTVSQY